MPQANGCSGAAAHAPTPEQSSLVSQACVGRPVQRRQSSLLVHGVNVSKQIAPPLSGCSPVRLPPQGIVASSVLCPVVISDRRSEYSTPVANCGSVEQSSEVPPNRGFTAPTMQVSPFRGPPSQVNVSPITGVSAGAPQRGHGCDKEIPRAGLERTSADRFIVPRDGSTKPETSSSTYVVMQSGRPPIAIGTGGPRKVSHVCAIEQSSSSAQVAPVSRLQRFWLPTGPATSQGVASLPSHLHVGSHESPPVQSASTSQTAPPASQRRTTRRFIMKPSASGLS